MALFVSALVIAGCGNREALSKPITTGAPEVIAADVATPTWAGFAESGFSDGRVTDEAGRPAAGVSVVAGGVEYLTGNDGKFRVQVGNANESLLIRKPGYQKLVVQPQLAGFEVRLKPLVIRGVYVQTGQVKQNDKMMQNVLRLIESTEVNALVIDVKDDNGRVHHDLAKHVVRLKKMGVYLIARIVTFKDNTITRTDPELALLAKDGQPWEDRHGVRYLDPFNARAHEYILQVATSAVKMGFDEVQFDYVRFPTDGNLNNIAWSQKVDWKTRSAAIAVLLKQARLELGALGAFVAADVFGITGHEPRDSGIGQHLETITPYLDFVCPMVYPSGYAQGTSGIANPPESPGPIVGDSVRRYRVRTQAKVTVRPWLQAFKDYNSFSGKFYGGDEIRAQIQASNQAGGSGFMLWNASGRYTAAGLVEKKAGVSVGDQL